MPLFLAPRRKNLNPQSQGGPDQYDRAQPSLFRYLAASRDLVGSTLLGIQFFTALAISTFAVFNKNKAYAPPVSRITTTWIPAGDEILPFQYPPVAMCFNNNFKPSRAVLTLLEKHGATEPQRIIVGKRARNVYYLQSITASSFMDIAALAPHTDSSYKPTMGYISPKTLLYYHALLEVVSVISSTFFHNFKARPNEANAVRGKLFYRNLCPQVDHKAHTTFMEEPFAERIDEGEEKKWCNDFDTAGPSEFLIHTGTTEAFVSSGDVTDVPFVCGLALPFETNFSQPDAFSFSSFSRLFPRFFDHPDGLVETYSGILQAWEKEICKTSVGECMAHFMKSLELCKELGCRLFPVFSVRVYQGIVLEGGRWTLVRPDGELVQPVSGDDFRKELGSLDLHSSTLQSILDKAKIAAVSPKDVKTMRALRTLVMLGDGPSGEVISYVSERLSQLNFREKYEGINLNAFQSVFNLLSSTMEIPDDLALHPDDFFSHDRVQLILSCFGRKVPSFSTGTNLRKLCKLSRGTGSEKAAEHSSTPPDVVQAARVSMSRAVGEWKKLMRQGMCSGEWSVKIDGFRAFTGREKIDLWAALSNFAHDCVKKDEAGESVGEKRAREGSEEGEILDVGPSVSKKAKQSLF